MVQAIKLTWFCDGQTPVYGWTEYRENTNNISPHPKRRDIIPNKYISRTDCVHVHPLTSDTFPVYIVHPITFTSYTCLNSLRVFWYTLRVYWFIAYSKKKKKRYYRNHWKFIPETFTVLGWLLDTINEIETVAGCTLFYRKRATVDNISD